MLALTPEAVVATSQEPRNLIVVASAGGGILASGWTVLALRNLIHERPQLVHEVRLLSGISGGSVGSAFYAQGLAGVEDVTQLGTAERDRLLDTVYCRATSSSLSATAYGFAFLDFWRLIVGGRLPWLQRWDRGLLLENAWARAASAEYAWAAGVTPDDCPPEAGRGAPVQVSMFGLRQAIKDGRIPALILGTTLMETGRRVMSTQVDFSKVPGQQRARTMTDFLQADEDDSQEADLSLWTAARLSATFPYVSPASRVELREDPDQVGVRPGGHFGQHFLDGGFFDNYGITSAFDFLQPVLYQRLREGDGEGAHLRFNRVVIVQLNPFPPTDPDNVEPEKGSIAAVAGPLLGVINIRNGVAQSRNQIDIVRFITSWNTKFQAVGQDVCLTTVEFRPPEGSKEGPLSWHMTGSQIRDQRVVWRLGMDNAPPSIQEQWQQLLEFLEQDTCAPVDLVPAEMPTLEATPAMAMEY